MLQVFMKDDDPITRGTATAALRYTLTDTDEQFDDFLRPVLAEMLINMLSDSDLENRRVALTALSSAIHNKPDLLLGQLEKPLALAIGETVVKVELVREVQMGPFKHKVDDGLEVRKVSSFHSPFPHVVSPSRYS